MLNSNNCEEISLLIDDLEKKKNRLEKLKGFFEVTIFFFSYFIIIYVVGYLGEFFNIINNPIFEIIFILAFIFSPLIFIFLLRFLGLVDKDLKEVFISNKISELEKKLRHVKNIFEKENRKKIIKDEDNYIEENLFLEEKDGVKEDEPKSILTKEINLFDWIRRKNKTIQKETTFEPIKIDFLKLNEKKYKIGLQGELIVIEYEKNKLKKLGFEELSANVIHISNELGDGAGYDILSFNESGEKIYIEVKTTKKGIEKPFYLSKKELDFIKEKQNKYFIYRVNILKNKIAEITKLEGQEILNNFDIVPNKYIVSKK